LSIGHTGLSVSGEHTVGHAQRRLPDGGPANISFLSANTVPSGPRFCREAPLSEGQPPTQESGDPHLRGRRIQTRAITSSNDAERRFLASLPEDEAILFRRAIRALVHAPG
jgi:hypothetical protein